MFDWWGGAGRDDSPLWLSLSAWPRRVRAPPNCRGGPLRPETPPISQAPMFWFLPFDLFIFDAARPMSGRVATVSGSAQRPGEGWDRYFMVCYVWLCYVWVPDERSESDWVPGERSESGGCVHQTVRCPTSEASLTGCLASEASLAGASTKQSGV